MVVVVNGIYFVSKHDKCTILSITLHRYMLENTLKKRGKKR